MSWQVLLKPRFDNGGGGVIAKEPGSYVVYDANGNVLERGQSESRAGKEGYKWQSSALASGRGAYFTLNGQRYNITNPGKRHEYSFGGSNPTKVSDKGAIGGGGSVITNQAGGTGNGLELATGSGTVGGGAAGQFITGPGGTQVFVPNFVNFDPTQFYISYDEADKRAEERADKNVDRFQENFSLAERLTAQNLNTEITALEAYLPRSTALIRNADAQGNRDILSYSDAFDQRNLSATQAASSANVEARKGYLDETIPGLFESGNAVRDRLEGDNTRIRERESQPLIADPLKETAARSARNMAADRGAAGGMGIDSTATRNLIDRFDFDKRLEIETANREDARKGDTAIQSSETAILNANQQAAANFQSLIQPGIIDFNPIQAAPRVTDIASQIKASPTTDAATIQRGFTGELTPLTTINPTQAFANSFEEQKNNRQLDLQALQFQQQQNDIIASAVNESSNLVVSEQRYQDQRALFEQALEQRRRGEDIQGGTALVTAGLGVLRGLISEYNKNPSDKNRSAVEGWTKWVEGILGKDWWKGGSGDSLTGTNGDINLDSFNVDDSTGTGGFWDSWDSSSGTTGTSDGTSTDFNLNDDPFAELASSSNYGPTTYDDSGNFNFASDEGKSLVKRSLSKNSFEGSSELNEQFSSLPDDQQEQYLANLNSFAEGTLLPENRDIVTATLGEYGISPATIAQAYNLIDNWEGMNDRDRAFATASVLNNMSTTMGSQAIPGYAMAFVNAIRQGANLYSNWDNMTDGERAEAGTNIAGGIAGAGATYMAAAGGAGASAGPIGMAVAVAFMAVARSTRIAIDEGFSNRANDAAITSPYQSFAHQVVTPYLDSKGVPDILNPAAFLSEQDRDNMALLIGYAPFLGVHSILGGDMDFTSGKSKDQQYRDYFRKVGEDPKVGSFLQKNEKGSHQLTLADGSKFDIGKDGGAKLKNYGTNIDGKTERQYSDVDWSNPQANEIVAIANPLSVLIFRSAEGKRMVGHLSNAISSKNPTDLKAIKSNAKHVALQAGVDYATGVLGLQKLKEEKSISEGTYDVYLKSWQDIMLR